MANKRKSGNGAFVFGLILGAIGGAAAALFMTPKSGDDMRKEIGSRVNQATGPVREKAQPVVSQGKERATGFIDKAADRAQGVSGKIAAMDLPFQDEGESEDLEGPAPAASEERPAT